MNLVEAAKSGRRFRRKVFKEGYYYDSGCNLFLEDILADDWEVKSEKKPRMFAWIDAQGMPFLTTDYSLAKPHYVRAEWLDEPEEK